MSINGYNIKIDGLIAGDSPESYFSNDSSTLDNNRLATLINICNYSNDISISCDYLTNMFPTIEKISIENVDIYQSKDYSNIVTFTIEGYDSDILPISY